MSGRDRDAGASVRVDSILRPAPPRRAGASIWEQRLEEELQICDDLRRLVVDNGRQLHRVDHLG
eukprot:1083886-Prymnesium_polylepis.1